MKKFFTIKNMYWRIFLLHFCIAFIYLFFTDWCFVTDENYNPIGMGIRLLMFSSSHLLITILALGVIGAFPKASSFITGRVVLANIASIVLVVFLYLLLDSLVLENILWELRGQ